MCGGTSTRLSAMAPEPGLSPRVRGNRFGERPGDLGIGSIPACAGEPQPAQVEQVGIGVYPRVCGGTPYW